MRQNAVFPFNLGSEIMTGDRVMLNYRPHVNDGKCNASFGYRNILR
ncbi:hypothetical protein CH54_3105 [Yersinia rochesterensis]|uniref:Uncharacterized protein n=1 Tax=Yersinia rochesterensis TaxID=1604335 RepID=A0ABN4FCE4_9GAMM|nr:hypothetical protein DJ57_3922 [Yersinia rochesterensis]AJI87504.1 hypothetical protein AW19_2683 [Yersinia frederiksenii Y225]AJJ35021.1 hypothetical protein CH54_3105 [Yersinia rochesterensis]CNH71777.1 Uncharacterised protein [Yersinia kristensenii]CRY64643.1 Uncharacterised protein [Yersinia kristensenii]